MQPYSIITLCTKNYRDAYNFVIDSWLRTKAEKIHIYTDDSQWVSGNDRIEIVHYFSPSTDWLKNVGRKVCVCGDSLTEEASNIIFIDIDCYITAEIGDIFDRDFDIAATRVNEPKLDASTGFFCFRNNETIRNFFVDWQADQERVKCNRRGVAEWCSAYEQIAFSALLRRLIDVGMLDVLSLNADWYNRKTRTALINHDALKDPRLRVLHFYQASFRDQECIKEVNKTFDLARGKLK